MKKFALLVAVAVLAIVSGFSFFRSPVSQAQDKPTAKTIEYLVLQNKAGAFPTSEKLTSLLDKNAEKGWEFCGCITNKDTDQFIFKRLKP